MEALGQQGKLEIRHVCMDRLGSLKCEQGWRGGYVADHQGPEFLLEDKLPQLYYLL